MPPLHSFTIAALSDAVGMAFFSGMGVFISVVADRYRQARHKLSIAEQALAPVQPMRRLFLNAGLVASLLFLAAAGWLSFRELKVMTEADQRTTQAYLVSQEWDRLLSALKDTETGQRGFLLTGEERYLEPYTAALAQVEQRLATLRNLSLDNPRQQASLAALEPLIQAELAELKETIELRRTQGLEASRQVAVLDKGESLMDQIRGQVAGAQADGQRLLQARTKVKEADTDRVLQALLAGGIFSLLLLAAIFFFLKQEIQQRLQTQAELLQHRDQLEVMVNDRTRQLSDNQKRLVAFGNAAFEGIFESENGRILDCNEQFARMLGRTIEDLKGVAIGDLVPAEDRDRVAENIRLNRDSLIEHPLMRGDGARIFVEAHGRPVSPETSRRLTAVRDVTERKRIEMRLRRFYETDLFAVMYWRIDGGVIDVNDRFLKMTGYTREDVRAGRLNWAEITPPEYQAQDEDARRQIRETGVHLPYEKEFICRDGTRVWGLFSAAAYEDDPTQGISFILDITARRLGEEALRRLNRTLRALSRSSQAMTHATGESEYMNEVCQDVRDCGHAMVWVGMAENDQARSVRPVAFAGFEEGYLETLHVTWDDTELGRGPTGTAIRTGQPAICQDIRDDATFAPWRTEALKRGYVSSLALPLAAAGKTFGAVTIYSRQPNAFTPAELQLLSEVADDLAHGITSLRDAAARKLAETSLAEREEQLRLFILHAPAAIAMLDTEMRYVEVSQEWLANYGLVGQSLHGRSHYEVFPEISQRWREIHRRCLAGAVERADEELFERADGTRQWLRWEVRPWRKPAGTVGGIIIFTEDISDRKRAEAQIRQQLEELRATRERLELALTSARMATFDWDILLNLRTWDQNVHHLLGTNAAAFSGQAAEFFQAIHPDDRSAVQLSLDRAIDTGIYETEYRAVWPEGSVRHIAARGTVRRDATGRAVRMTGVCWDISERKQAEAQIRILAIALQSAANAIVITDRNGIIEWVNPAFTRLTGYGVNEAIGRNPRVLKSGAHPPEFYAGIWRAVLAGRVWHGELINKRKDGTCYNEEMTIAPVSDSAGTITHFIAIKQDITERKQDLERVQASLREKEVMLKEIHHRVKNNLQVISSLVSLHADALNQPMVREAFGSVRDQVRAMALVHEKLYRSENLAHVEFAGYVRTLLQDLWRAHGSLAANVTLRLDLEPLSLS
ncbi:MAG TPA: PAS domain S-box protein, partial [Candidatus Acidoferrales bacterium]|nr:PAS domain S-box protein [Candidatus Acidoferrales bacterium]